MSVLEKQITKLQRRVEELDKVAAEARVVKQELEDRVNAGKVNHHIENENLTSETTTKHLCGRRMSVLADLA
jgi:hypothetical protein